MGSTSFHLLVADVCASGTVESQFRRREHLQLGRWIGGSRRIPARVCEEAVAAARSLVDLAREHGAERVLLVGTAAFRAASNGAELASSLERALGMSVHVLSGVEEACVLFTALRQKHQGFEAPVLGMDLGGGSLELARGDASGVAAALTLPLGVVLLHSLFSVSDPLPRSVEEKLRAHVSAALVPARAAGLAQNVGAALASGGSLRALKRVLAARNPRRRACDALAAPLLRELAEELARSTRSERRRMPGMNPRRIDTLPAAAVIVSEMTEVLELEAITVSDWGVREGILLEAARGRR